ncbi:hypothetical protein H7X46_11435 [Pseudonocardia sp. C8]|uniref:hypothetical protein n=1 Tax=Pseudonocardia sp. C8 TaxID=2762759 RepID=UPI00164261AC|nr:hypothetical protein [Pseudonocardia sp. C8]MBC3191673.1 hypothetical protein [Pseudonocardia sp. C8]
MHEMNNQAPAGYHRIVNDDASGITVTDPDPVAYSPAALAVLREHGVDTYEREMALCRAMGREAYELAVTAMIVEAAEMLGEEPTALVRRLVKETTRARSVVDRS